MTGAQAAVWIAPIVTAIVTLWLARHCADPSSRLYLPDAPNARSLHAQVVSRSGGVAIIGGMVVGWLAMREWFAPVGNGLMMAAMVVVLAAISWLDDRIGLSPVTRLFVHLGLGIAALAAGLAPQALGLPGVDWAPPVLLAEALCILGVAWAINLFNFMDGSDGFATLMAASGFGTYAVLGWRGGAVDFALAALVVSSAAAAFLWWNRPPARIFMGDSGAAVLGLLFALFSLEANRGGLFPVWTALLVFSPFVVDATVTLIRRLLLGRSPLRAHRDHYYQRWLLAGGTKRGLFLHSLWLMGLSAVLGIASHDAGPQVQWMVLAGIAVLYLAIARVIDRRAPLSA
ncbi:MAG: hypothetical protein KDG50_12855 [Chromatiales bacterium]|nr:hypothetical protein [Chromatiales bacterium]